MRTRAELRSIAKEQLRGQWTGAVLFTLVAYILMSVAGWIAGIIGGEDSPLQMVGSIENFLVMVGVSYSLTVYFAKIAAGEKPGWDILKEGFQGKNYVRMLIYELIVGAIGFGISFLAIMLMMGTTGTLDSVNMAEPAMAGFLIVIGIAMIIVGVIVSMVFAQVPFILVDEPETKTLDAIKRSREMMKNHWLDYFILTIIFSLVGIVAALFTCGVGMLWLVPYMMVTFANYYRALKEDRGEYDVAAEPEEVVEQAEVVEVVEETEG